MCGINGFYNYSSQHIENGSAIIQQMNNRLEHRGPDDEGIFVSQSKSIYLGHRRLSILDLSEKGHQPMIDTHNHIVFNGEIYNFKELKNLFHGQNFRSDTDTEVILKLYAKDGYQCLERLSGMFSFAIWDESKEKLFLARDRVGIKPLYYTEQNGVFAFSSEIKSLLLLPWVKQSLDEKALYYFLTFNYVDPPYTMFENIYKFQPGYCMVVGQNGIEEYKSYWEVNYQDYSSYSTSDLENLIFSELSASVQSRMISDVPVGAFLSGGVDSSAIVAFMRDQSSQPIKTYSIGFENAPKYNELEHARQVAQQFSTTHIEKIVTKEEIVNFLPKIVDIFDEPLADSTSIPIYFISKLARKNGTTVVLTGDGGDELFCGYSTWAKYAQLYPLYNLWKKLPSLIQLPFLSLYELFDKSSPRHEIFSRASRQEEFFWASGGFKESHKNQLLSKSYLTKMKDIHTYSNIQNYLELFSSIHPSKRKNRNIDWMCFLGLKKIIPNHYLYRADRLGMVNSIEIRVPFLHHNFVNLALSIEGNRKVNQREPKYLLKKSLEKKLPQDILYRKKQGFCVPLHEWTKDILIDSLDKELHSFCQNTQFFNEELLKYQLQEAKKGNPNYTFSIWNIYFLTSWFRRWFSV